jgi:hypothetical protein
VVFEKLLAGFAPQTYLFDFAQGFGCREDNDARTLTSYRWHIDKRKRQERKCDLPPKIKLTIRGNFVSMLKQKAEFTYVVRYYAQNGRNYGDPWSMRQTAVHEQRNTAATTSTWLLIQPSTDACRRLQDCLESHLTATTEDHAFHRSMQIHTTLLFVPQGPGWSMWII